MELTPVAAAPSARARALTARVPTPLFLGALVAAIVGLNVWWASLESRPPHWEMANHLGNSLVYLHDFRLTDPASFLTGYLYYPPLVYWVTDIFYAALGSGATTVALLSNAVWIAVLVFATFGLGKRLWNARVGWLSVAFVVTAPMVVSASKEYMLELPLTAMAALCLYLLVRADGFSSTRFSLMFGLAAGLGFLVMWRFPLVLLVPGVHAAAVALADARQRRSFGRLANLAASGALTLAISAIWYIPNLQVAVSSRYVFDGREGVVVGSPPVASLESATWYLWHMLDVQLYLLPFVFAIVGVAFCIGKRRAAVLNLYPLLTIAGTLALFTLLRHKEARYTLPMLPALAVVATSWLEFLSARARMWTAGVLVAYGTAAFLAISFGASFLPSRSVVFAQHGYVIGPPTDEEWHEADAVRSLAGVPPAERTFRYEGPDTMWLNSLGLRYYALRYNAQLVASGPARFIVYRGPLPSTPPGFVELRRWRLPDGSSLGTYERLGAH